MRYEYIDAIDRFHPVSGVNKTPKEAGAKMEKLFHNHAYIAVNRHVTCSCCRTIRSPNEFIVKGRYNPHSFFGIEIRSKSAEEPLKDVRGNICIHCLVELHKMQMETYGMDQFAALYSVCAIANHYYDDEYAHRVYADTDRVYRAEVPEINGVRIDDSVTWVELYFRSVYSQGENDRKDFWSSENFQFNRDSLLGDKKQFNFLDTLSEEDRKNYDTILSTFHYDPFEDDPPKDRSKLMTQLVTMIDDAMKDDFIRMKAALEVVRSFYRMEKWDRMIKELEDDGPDGAITHNNDIKKIAEMKSKEAKTVSEFAKDNGFTEKYANSKKRGTGTMSAIVRDMEDAHYDFGAINRYDIETAAAIKQVSDISAESIFKQLNLQTGDYVDMVKEQAAELTRLRTELSSKSEELRLFKEKELKQEILEELREELLEKGLPTDNVDEMIKREIRIKKQPA